MRRPRDEKRPKKLTAGQVGFDPRGSGRMTAAKEGRRLEAEVGIAGVTP